MFIIKKAILFWLSAVLFFSWPAHASETDPTLSQLNHYLWEGARKGDIAVINTLIDGGFNLDTADEKGYTAIILAAYHGHDDVVQALLAAGADPCLRDKRGNSALMGAVFKGELTVARRLIRADCNVNQRNQAGQTAAMYAALFQRKELLRELSNKGADMKLVDDAGNNVEALSKGTIRTSR
ncbi:TPA: ankyrin repeat domain-containing protein [Serratia marcescens]|jgi:ankyrin repeat protein|uniref:ankyrin repeat domain-containing protein n=1 Tax=Serratia TaxID=613 RepID=UPI00062C4D15|nr:MULTISPECIES: ankyrin repeat domain-containing protein [Serratia]KKZ18260.1 ankyrin [Serratia marcescens]MBE4974281.1 ankyrin repeat domain-containing protein [Serratia sp. X3]MBH2669115.1 ankyrin repeat domain-containing protein [Serratia marcescens]MBH2674057.1 ankyrin repeat domain-containing protein [Serratia marcescens]MBH3300591.1 ankyrin repeat domain-containing protein [Serratia marcescens]